MPNQIKRVELEYSNFDKVEPVVQDFLPHIKGEHIFYTFRIKNISRALLQEVVRHQHLISYSVKSSRYTLKEVKEHPGFEEPFTTYLEDGKKEFDIDSAKETAKEFLLFDGDNLVDKYSIYALENLRKILVAGVSNDHAKYCLPESYKTEVRMTINVNALNNFIKLRNNKAALWEAQLLAKDFLAAIPEHHLHLFTDCLLVEKEEH